MTPAGAPLDLKNAPNGTRVLLDEKGWTVSKADQSDPHDWDVDFSRGSVGLSISAFPASDYSPYLTDRHVTASTPTIAVLGTRAPLIRQGDNDWETLVPPHLGQMLDIRATMSRTGMIQVLDQLRWVDEATWETAMPTNVVTSSRELAVAERMLHGIPLPPGLTPADMIKGFTNDLYHNPTEHVIAPKSGLAPEIVAIRRRNSQISSTFRSQQHRHYWCCDLRR